MNILKNILTPCFNLLLVLISEPLWFFMDIIINAMFPNGQQIKTSNNIIIEKNSSVADRIRKKAVIYNVVDIKAMRE